MRLLPSRFQRWSYDRLLYRKESHVPHIQLDKFLLAGLQLWMQGEEIIDLILQQGGTDVFSLTFHFANHDRLVQFVSKNEVDLVSAFAVSKNPNVGVVTVLAGLLTEIAFQHDPGESRVVAQERLFEQFDAARLYSPYNPCGKTEPECQEIVCNIVSHYFCGGLAEYWTHLPDDCAD